MPFPYPDCVGHIKQRWVRVIAGRIHIGIDIIDLTPQEALEAARLLRQAAIKADPSLSLADVAEVING